MALVLWGAPVLRARSPRLSLCPALPPSYFFCYCPQIDDVVQAVPVHLAAGAWGVVAAGLFPSQRAYARSWGAGALAENTRGGGGEGEGTDAAAVHEQATRCAGVFYGGSGRQLGVNLIELAVVVAWAALASGALFGALRARGCLRVSRLTEQVGLDEMIHNDRPGRGEEARAMDLTLGGAKQAVRASASASAEEEFKSGHEGTHASAWEAALEAAAHEYARTGGAAASRFDGGESTSRTVGGGAVAVSSVGSTTPQRAPPTPSLDRGVHTPLGSFAHGAEGSGVRIFGGVNGGGGGGAARLQRDSSSGGSAGSGRGDTLGGLLDMSGARGAARASPAAAPRAAGGGFGSADLAALAVAGQPHLEASAAAAGFGGLGGGRMQTILDTSQQSSLDHSSSSSSDVRPSRAPAPRLENRFEVEVSPQSQSPDSQAGGGTVAAAEENPLVALFGAPSTAIQI